MANPTVGVLALQGDVREHLAALAACGVGAVPVRRPAELARVDGLVLPGGESTTISRLLGVFELLEPLRARIASGMPAYGSCAGMILLAAEVLDGHRDQQQVGGLDVVVRRNAFGRQVDSFEADLTVEGVPDQQRPVRAVFIRAPWVEKVGAEVEVLASVPALMLDPAHRSAVQMLDPAGRSAVRMLDPASRSAVSGEGVDAGDAAGRAVAVRQGVLLATAFHPELTGDGRVHALFAEIVRSA